MGSREGVVAPSDVCGKLRVKDTQYSRAKEIFLAALERPEAERMDFVRSAAGTDRELLAEIESLLEHDSGKEAGSAAGALDQLVFSSPTQSDLERLRVALADRYRVESELGVGGMATVYRATDLRHDRQVAIKVLPPEITSLLGAKRFVQEIKIVAQLHHPHILQLYDSGEVAGRLFYVMPLVEGGSARDRIKEEGKLPLDDAVRILRDVADALAEAHGKGVVHRDIKPDNVLISGRHSLVADFGLAKVVSAVGGSLNLTRSGIPMGTPAYMSPEQVVSDPEIDYRTDIYSFGVLAFELYAGRTPFGPLSPREMLSAHLTTAPPDLSALRDDLPSPLVSLVKRCLEKRPEDRFQETEDILSILEGYVHTSGDSSGAGVRTSRSSRRKWVWGTAVLMSLLAFTTLAIMFFEREHPISLDNDRILVAGFVNETGEPTLDHLGGITADWISRGLQETGAKVVLVGGFFDPDPQSADSAGRTGLDKAIASAESYGAGTVLTGSYYRHGDSVQFLGRLVNTQTGELRVSLTPVTGPLTSPLDAVDLLRRRIMSAADFISSASQSTMAIRPPLYEAYREWLAALRLTAQQDHEGALQRYLRAYELDTTFTVALIMVTGMLMAEERYAEVDSSLRALERRLPSLTPLERAAWEGQSARMRGDLEGWLAGSRRVAEIMPFSPGTQDLAEGPIFLNRPGEAISFLERLDFSQEFVRGWVQFWRYYHDAFHMLGQFEEALEVAERARIAYPTSLVVGLIDTPTLAALGRIDELDDRFDAALARPPQPGVDLGDWMIDAAAELRAHGHMTELGQMLRRFERWMASSSAGEAATPTRRRQVVDALNLEGRHAEALRVIQALADSVLEDVDALGRLGRTAAAAGDRDLALYVDSLLSIWDQPYVFGSAQAWRARIAANLGDSDQAVSLLREAFAQGLPHGPWLHRDNSLESLRGYAPFDELVEPQG